jgi:hypothetical protein
MIDCAVSTHQRSISNCSIKDFAAVVIGILILWGSEDGPGLERLFELKGVCRSGISGPGGGAEQKSAGSGVSDL